MMTSTPKKLTRLLTGKSRASLTRRPAPDKWSIGEILAHLADAELSFSWRIRLMLEKNGTAIQAYDQDAWAAFSHYPKLDPRLSLDAFRTQRERNVQLLRVIPKEIWDNYGMHEERGRETVARLAEMMAGHDINHLRQVEGMVTGSKKGPRGGQKSDVRGQKRYRKKRGARGWG